MGASRHRRTGIAPVESVASASGASRAAIARLLAAALAAATACRGGAPASSTSEDAGAHDVPDGDALVDETSAVPGGVPPERCVAPYFVPDGDHGCAPVVPPAPCAPPLVARLGDTACEEIAPCGDAAQSRWGDAPVDAETVYVDAAAAADGADGSAAHPWPTLTGAIDAAADGALIAIAAGAYAERLTVSKSVRLWGRCPRLTVITGILTFVAPPRAIELHHLTLRTVTRGYDALEGAVATALVDGSDIDGTLILRTATDVTVRRARLGDARIGTDGAHVTIDETYFATAVAGGVAAQFSGDTLDVHAVVADGSGFGVTSRRATIAASLFMHEGSLFAGDGAAIWIAVPPSAPAALTVTGSVVVDNASRGILAEGAAEVHVVDTVVARTRGADRDTLVDGAIVADAITSWGSPTVTIEDSLVDDNDAIGVAVIGADLAARGLLVRSTRSRPADGLRGRGLDVEYAPDAGGGVIASHAIVARSAFVDNREIGVASILSELSLDGVVVRGTRPNAAGVFGDGVTINGGTATITNGTFDANARAGIASFGAHVALRANHFDGNGIDLDGENDGASFDFADDGENVCAADGGARTCVVLTASLAPPERTTP